MQIGGRTIQRVTVEQRIIRADGRVEDLGVTGFWSTSRLERWRWRVGQWWKKVRAHAGR